MSKQIMEIRELEPAQITFVYNTYMEIDFPKDELKPLKAITAMFAQGIYDCLGLYQGEELVAYAFFVKHQERRMLLLDYLAVTPAHRSGGVGSIFIALMKEYYAGYQAILLECESECTAPDEEQRLIRKRRIHFYLRNGCTRTPVKSFLYGVEYEILCVNISGLPADITGELEALYRLMFSDEIMDRWLRLWQRHGILCDVKRWQTADEDWHDAASVCDALGIGRGEGQVMPRLISFVGGGGKTTTMYQLADELAERGFHVIVTTSTHIRCPQTGWVVCNETMEDAISGGFKEKILTIGNLEADTGKLTIPDDLTDPAAVERILNKDVIILVEADGAKCHPLKVPGKYEPMLVPQTEMVIACAGLSALGQTFAAGCFRFDSCGQWLHRSGDDRISGEDMALIVMDDRGCRKGVSRLGCEYRIVLNQADDEALIDQACSLVQLLPQFMKPGCMITRYERDNE